MVFHDIVSYKIILAQAAGFVNHRGEKNFALRQGASGAAEGLFGTLHKNKGESSENAPGDCIKC